jgi:hypothetical protein
MLVQGTLAYQVEGLSVFGNGGFIAQLYLAGSSFRLGGASSSSGNLAAQVGQWYSLEMDLDFQNQTATAYVDGQFLATVAMATPTTSLTELQFGGYGDTTDSETAFYDDFSATAVTAAPEPSSLALIAMGGVSLTGWRRWKTLRAAR